MLDELLTGQLARLETRQEVSCSHRIWSAPENYLVSDSKSVFGIERGKGDAGARRARLWRGELRYTPCYRVTNAWHARRLPRSPLWTSAVPSGRATGQPAPNLARPATSA